MTVRWVTAIPPCFDARGGGEIRQAHLLEALAQRFDVQLLLAGRLEDRRVRALAGSVREVPVEIAGDPRGRTRRRLRDIRWQVIERQPDEVARQKRIRHALASELAGGPRADIVCVEYIGLAQLLPARRAGLWALTLHNLTSEMARHSARIAPGRRQRIMLGFEERNSCRLERWALGAYDLVVAVSNEDAARLGGGVAVVPNGVDADRLRPTPLPAGPRVAFTGALHTLPNRDGIGWFCEHVWPSIRARIPDATLDVVGAAPAPEVLALGALPGVRVHPDVPDVAPFLERARVTLVPLRIGTGSRLKALEAMAAGRPVAGTSIGLGGLDVEPGREALVADDPAELARAVVQCLTDDELAGRLAAHGRELVERRYSWSTIGADYAELLEARSAGARARVPSAR